MKDQGLPLLVRFVIKWTAIGIAGGLVVLAGLIVLDVGGLGGLVFRSSAPGIALYALAMSFAGTGGPVAVTIAVLLQRDFGKAPSPPPSDRLARWKAGYSAELRDEDADKPLP